jgi:hypothetical protein
LTQNILGASLSLEHMLGRNGGPLGGISWALPSSAWANFGQGKVTAFPHQGIAGDTTSDVSFGLSWNTGKLYANFGYWQSLYQSQLYPWKGYGINGSLGFHKGVWGIDLYFDLASSSPSYYVVGIPQTFSQGIALTSGIFLRARF